jgi:hypothetical protein
MAQGMEANAYLCDLCREFSRQRQLVRVEVSEVSNLILSAVYQPSSGCTCGKQIQHFPSYVRHLESVESRDRSKLQVRCSKRSAHHRVQILRGVKVGQHGDTESLRIYLSESQMGVRSDLARNARCFRMLQPLLRES